MDQDGPACIFQSQNPQEAALVREMLEAHGLRAFLFDSNAAGSVAMFGPAILARVMVPAGDREAALEIIKEHDGELQ